MFKNLVNSALGELKFSEPLKSFDIKIIRQLFAGLSPRWPWFAPKSFHVEFVVDNVTLGQAFRRSPRLSSVNVVLSWLSILMCHLGVEQQARWRPHFGDIFSFHRQEQQTLYLNITRTKSVPDISVMTDPIKNILH
jgi:hypothetical protein